MKLFVGELIANASSDFMNRHVIGAIRAASIIAILVIIAWLTRHHDVRVFAVIITAIACFLLLVILLTPPK